MQVPVKVLAALKPSVNPAVLAAVASSTIVFVATPFLLAGVADQRDISLGAVGWISTTQLLGFVVASWASGRFLTPSRTVFVVGTLLGVCANLASAVAPTLAALAGTRGISGLSLGLAAWFGWQEAFGDPEKTGDVAVVGPAVGVVGSPVISLIVESVGVDAVFVLLAAVTAVPLLLAHRVTRHPAPIDRPGRHTPTRAARVILIALGLVTLGGSSVFVYAAAIGTNFNGLSPATVSLLFSCNALAGIPAARWRGARGPAGVWFLGTAVMAVLLTRVGHPVLFAIGLVGWGFWFFMAIPAAFNLLAARSAFPAERAGDAQAAMALGRVFGPLLGGALIAHGSTNTLGFCAAGTMTAAAVALLYVQRDTLPLTPTKKPTVRTS